MSAGQGRRVVVTGMGAVTSLGLDAPTTWAAMKDGRTAIGPLTTIAVKDLKCRIGAEIVGFDVNARVGARQANFMDRVSQLAVAAAREAEEAARLPARTPEQAARVTAIVGTAVGGFTSIEESYHRIWIDGAPRVHTFTVPRVMPSAPASQVGIAMGAMGPTFGVTSACASGNHAVGLAYHMLKSGMADVAFAGGAEAPLCYGVIRAWEALRVLAPDTCRPFSAGRAGLVLGEGAAILVLETLEHARARGAPVRAEIVGFGMTADAVDLVAPTVDGPARAMEMALREAGIGPGDVQLVNAHGSGTQTNDATETLAVRRVFGDHAAAISVSATKSMHGHALGASAAIELIAVVGSLEDGVIAPTANFSGADPECDLDVTPNHARQRDVRFALSNAFAFGGLNAVLALGRAPA